MLEGLVANLLNRFLGMYIKNFDPKQLNVGIWNGDMKLRNLQLRREALDQLHLPVNVVEGHIGQLTVSIPWSNLKGKPVRVNIEDVFLLAAPQDDESFDAEEEEKRQQAVKIEKLDSAELLKEKNVEGQSQEEQQKNQSFTDSLVTRIVDNLQVAIKNSHIRYEDSVSASGNPFAIGMTLEEFSAVSTDANWTPSFIQTSTGTTHKLATLKSLAMYWNTESSLFGTGKGADVGAEAQDLDKDAMLTKFREMITEGKNQQYILKPVSGRAAVEMDKTGKTDKPKLKARLIFNELGFMFDDEQYRDALMMVDLFHYFIRHQEYKKDQPKATPKEDPRAWLKFVGDAVLKKIHDRNRRWSWDFMKERRDDRIRYIELFKKKKKEEKMTPAETEELNNLEFKLNYEDLRFWRSLARNQLKKENVGVKPKQKQTWASWGASWVSRSAPKKEDEHHDEENTELSEQQRKELYEAIDWDEKKAIAESVDVPRDSVKLQVDMSLKSGSFTLKRDPHGKGTEILSVHFDSFKTKVLQRPDSFLADLSLAGMRIFDGTTEGSLFPQIVGVKDAPPVPDDERIEELDDDEATKDKDEKISKPAGDEPFFALQFEQNPLDESADTAVTVKLKSMEIIYNPKFVVEIAKFFKPPERHMDSIGALMESAGATVEGIRQQTRAGLEFALEEHKTINAKLDLQAPLIIIPESVVEESTICLILDAGHVSLNSDLIDQDTIKDIQSKQKQQFSEEDFKNLEKLMYDKFVMKLDSTQVLIGPSVQDTKAQLDKQDDPKNMHLIDRINMDFLIETCIIPKATDLTKFRISGHLPVLHASISDAKYKKLMKLIDVAIPKFESDEEQKPGSDAVMKEVRDVPATQKSKSESSAAKSFQFTPQQQAILDEEDTEDEGDEKSLEEDNAETARIHQRNFELKFTVDKLQGSLYRSDPDEKKPDKLLVELVAEHFVFDFYLRPFDMVAEVLLKSLNVDDHIEEDPTPEFKQIISSEGFDAKDDKDLFYVKFIKVNPESPEFKSTFEGIATNLDVSVSTLNLVVTRKTLLTLLDFVLITFTNPDAPPPEKAVEDSKEAEHKKDTEKPATSDDKIRIKANLESVNLILNNDGLRLATLSLKTADVSVFLMGKSMRVGAKLGNLSLLDDINQGASEDSSMRQLIAIQGDELADFKYETFDAEADSYPGYDSSIFLRSGSIKVNFLEEPFRKIIDFAVKFGKMQAIFNAARQAAANQASQIQENAGKMHFDILVKTPIIVFPRLTIAEDKAQRDLVTVYLGELYASNEFSPLEDSNASDVANKLSAGVRNIRLTSYIQYKDDKSEELEMIDKVDIDFKITYVEHKEGSERPDLEIEGSMSTFNLRISQTQLKLLLQLSKTVPAAFATDPEQNEEDVAKELPKATVKPAQAVLEKEKELQDEKVDDDSPKSQGPELGMGDDKWTKLDLVFKVGMIGLELILSKEGEPVGDLEAASLSKFSLNDTNVKLRMISDGGLESELLIQSFTIRDSRTKETNKFRKIMSLINNDVKQQFQASVSISGGKKKNLIAILSIDSPRVIMALDYLFAVQAFITSSLAVDEPTPIEQDGGMPAIEDADSTADENATAVTKQPTKDEGQSESDDEAMTISYRLNVVDAQIILIANPTISSSEAIVLGTKQVLLSQQNSFTLQVSKVGMFLCRMDQFDTSRLRILDDFTIQVSMDTRSKGNQSSMTSINIDIEPLVLRLSLRDILLALQIVNKASEMSSKDEKPEDPEPKKIKEVKAAASEAPSKRRTSTTAKKTSKSIATRKTGAPPPKPKQEASAVIKREELTATIEGIRVVLIGDLHELPLLDISVKNFSVGVRDWTGAMSADTSIDTFINVFNFSKSAWEPLVEPWQVGFHMSKDINPDQLSVELYSRKSLEVTVTSASIALASKSAQFLSQDVDVLSKPRGVDAPYKIRNYTGFEINVWADTPDEQSSAAAKLEDGEEAPWRFEEQTKMRENLSPESNAGIVGVKLEGSGFQSVERIPVTREGETLYNLKPRKDKIQHRLLVDVELGADNVKYITFRSPLLVENNTQIPIEVGVFSPEEGNLLKVEKVQPGESRPAPVGAAFMHSLLVRPDQGFGYNWSNQKLFWKDLLKRNTRSITCNGENGEQTPPFYFQMNAKYDKNNPLTRYVSLLLSFTSTLLISG